MQHLDETLLLRLEFPTDPGKLLIARSQKDHRRLGCTKTPEVLRPAQWKTMSRMSHLFPNRVRF
ncbi:hypothetical protein ACM42_08585 [Bradyrhizobium sp. CCBAU 25338]|nr:hypothetical protein [Bradyrhizobium sp. CCBAU 25338]